MHGDPEMIPAEEVEATEDGQTEAPDSQPKGPGLEKAQPQPYGEAHLRSVIESVVFVSDKPLSPAQIAKAVRAELKEVKEALEVLVSDYAGRGIELAAVGPGYQFRTAAANAPFVRDHVAAKPVRLSRPQLETLAIVAYRQPATKPEVDEVRGVDSGAALKVLDTRGLVRVIGRKEEPGRPLLYGTTPKFLEFFGLRRLSELPTLKEFGELSDESRSLFEKKMGEPLDLSELHGVQNTESAPERDEGSEIIPEAEEGVGEEALDEELLSFDGRGEGEAGSVEDDEEDASVREVRDSHVAEILGAPDDEGEEEAAEDNVQDDAPENDESGEKR